MPPIPNDGSGERSRIMCAIVVCESKTKRKILSASLRNVRNLTSRLHLASLHWGENYTRAAGVHGRADPSGYSYQEHDWELSSYCVPAIGTRVREISGGLKSSALHSLLVVEWCSRSESRGSWDQIRHDEERVMGNRDKRGREAKKPKKDRGKQAPARSLYERRPARPTAPSTPPAPENVPQS
jgi:hypothetical protein